MLEITDRSPDYDLPLSLVALLQLPLWAGYVGAVVYAGRRKGVAGVRGDFGLDARPVDVPIGAGAGLVTQLVIIPVVYAPLLRLLDETSESVERVARDLTDRASGDVGGVILLVLVVVVGAPVVEELFYRGLLMRSLERRWGPGWALVLSSLVFAAAHFQGLQLPALVVFGLVAGYLAQRYGRLGPAIAAHVAFNGVTVLLLLV